MERHVDTNTLLEFVEGLLEGPAAEQVERHMDSCPRCRRVVAEMGKLAAGGPQGTHPGELPEVEQERGTKPAPGQMVDHFRLVHRLGSGGMGEVFLARDTQLGRKVALKLLRSTGRVAQMQRLLFEARTTARFSHPNIVAIHAVGEHRGSPYLALEYVDGETLQQRARRQSFGVREVARLGISIAEALVEAHQHEVLHRDLKPSNVMLGRDGRVRVLDFGLALSRGTPEPSGDAQPGDRGGSLESGSVRGTPGYMAPEQWRGGNVSSAADIWALGVMLFELLSGKRPWDADDREHQRQLVCSTAAPPLVSSDELPAPLCMLVANCLARDPEQRPGAPQVVRELQALLPARAPSATSEESPFRGLLPFDEQHQGLFFGRDAEIAAVVERLRQVPVLPVVGPSGVGKSSFLQAGVVPRLREQGALTVISLRPGRHPFSTLATRLLATRGASHSTAFGTPHAPDPLPPGSTDPRPPSPPDPRRLARQLRRSPQRLNLELLQLAQRSDSSVLLLLDQAEELYTLTADAEERRAFMQALCGAADLPDAPVRVLFTLRDDFLGRLAEGPEARQVLGQITVLGRPGPAALEQIVTRPVQAVGYAYDDPQLPQEMVDAIEGELSCLPLLQFAGEVLWRRRDRKDRKLRRADYQELGGVAGALARHADEALAALAPGEVELARAILLRLTTPQGTRRQLPRAEALEGLGEAAGPVLGRLTAARLVTSRQAEEGQEPGLDLAHESLVHTWTRLRRWMEASRGERTKLDEMQQAALLWEQRGRSAAEVWQGEALRDAADLARRSWPPSAVVAQFLRAGQQLQAGQAHKKRLRRLVLAGALALLAAGSLVAALVMRQQGQEAAHQRTVALQQRAAALRQGAQVQREAARRALAQGDLLEARARIRGSLEVHDSAASRMLWWELSKKPLSWSRRLGETVNHVTHAPHGRLLAAASADGAIYLLEAISGTVDQVLRGHQDQVLSLAFNRDGERLVSGSWDGEVRVWDLKRGSSRVLQQTGQSGSSAIYSVAFSPNNWVVAAGGRSRKVKLWDARNGNQRRVLQGHRGSVMSLSFDPTGQLLASCGKDRTVRIWDIVRGKQTLAAVSHRDTALSVAFSPDGATLASGSIDGEVRLRARAGGPARLLARLPSGATELSFSPRGDRLAVAGMDRTVRILEVPGGRELQRLTGHRDIVWGVSFSPDGKQLASASVDRTVRAWSPGRAAAQPHTPAPHTAAVLGLAFSPDGATLASGGRDRVVILWDVASGRRRRVLRGHGGVVRGVGFSPDGRLLASGSYDRTVRVWELASATPWRLLQGHSAEVWDVSFGPAGRLLASGGKEGTARIWDVASGASLRSLRGHRGGVFGPRFSRDGLRLVTGGYDGTVRVWRAADGLQQSLLRGHGATVYGVDFSPDGKLVASGGSDGTVRIWDLTTGQGKILGRHPGRIFTLQFSPDGSRVGAAGSDGTARVWPLAGGAQRVLRGHRRAVRVLRFGPHGQRLATGGSDGTVRLWQAASGRPLWRATLALPSPAVLHTHAGWRSLDTGRPTASMRASAWSRAATGTAADGDAARMAVVDDSGRWLCLITASGALQLWDTQKDRRLFASASSRSFHGTGRLLARPRGCVALAHGVVSAVDALGTISVLAAGDATAVALADRQVLVAGGTQVTIHSASGARKSLPAGAGITALARAGQHLILGYGEGNLELRPLSGDTPRGLERSSASAVERLLAGPGQTLVAGHADGSVGLWSLATGRRLRHDRLHGPVTRLLLRDHKLYATTELGAHLAWDLAVLQLDYCELMRRVWRDVPVIWRGSMAARAAPPAGHRCRHAR